MKLDIIFHSNMPSLALDSSKTSPWGVQFSSYNFWKKELVQLKNYT